LVEDDDWLVRKQTELLQDIIEAKAITVELLENLTILANVLLCNAKRMGMRLPQQDAILHLIRRSHVLLETSRETTTKLLQSADEKRPPDKLPMYPIGGSGQGSVVWLRHRGRVLQTRGMTGSGLPHFCYPRFTKSSEIVTISKMPRVCNAPLQRRVRATEPRAGP
jgi:hypothetical protein